MREARLRVALGGLLLALTVAGTGSSGLVTPAAAGSACDVRGRAGDRAAMQARFQACYAERRLADAVAVADAWLAAHPDDRATRLELARIASETGDLARAEVAYDALLAGGAGGSERPALRKARADVLAWRGKLDDALAEYRALLVLNPDDARVLLGLGLALRWQGRTGDAAGVLRRAVAADPRDAEAERALAELEASPAYRAWRADQERAAAPDDATRWAVAVDALTAAEDYSTAEARLRAALARWPADRRLGTSRARLERERAARVEARLAAVQTALAADPNDGPARRELAGILAERKDLAGAVAAYRQYVAAHPEDVDAQRQLARVLSWQGDTGASLARYDTLLAAQPDDDALRLERARVLAWDGQLNEAASELRAARAADPAAAHRTLGDVWRWAGRRGAAGVHYGRALRLDDLDGEHARAADDFFRSEGASGNAVPTVGAIQDSDRFNSLRFAIEARQRLGVDTELTLGVGRTDYDQRGTSLYAERLRFNLLHDFDERWRVVFGWSPAVYDGDRQSQNAIVALERAFAPESVVTLGYERVDIIDEVLTVDSASDDVITADRVRLTGRHVLPWRFEVAADASFATYSDGNRLVTARGSIGRRLLRRDPGLTLRAETAYIGYAERTDLYWDPAQYVTTGLVLTLAQSITENVRVLLEGRVGYGDQEGTGALERGFAARVEVAALGPFAADLAYQYGETGQVGGRRGGDGYTVHSGTLGLRYSFGAT